MTDNTSRRAVAPKAIIFDLDDTLVVSTIEFMKFRTRLISFLEGKVAEISRYSMRETTVEMIARFEEEMRANKIDERVISSYLDEIDTFLNEIELENIKKTVPVEGAKELLASLKQRKVKIGILTRGSPEYAKAALRIAGLDRFVDAMVSRDRKSGIKPKPSPESALALAEKLGVDIEDTVMVGDYSIDFLCARDTGIRFFGIASDDDSRRSLNEAGCGEILSSLYELRERIGL